MVQHRVEQRRNRRTLSTTLHVGWLGFVLFPVTAQTQREEQTSRKRHDSQAMSVRRTALLAAQRLGRICHTVQTDTVRQTQGADCAGDSAIAERAEAQMRGGQRGTGTAQ